VRAYLKATGSGSTTRRRFKALDMVAARGVWVGAAAAGIAGNEGSSAAFLVFNCDVVLASVSCSSLWTLASRVACVPGNGIRMDMV